MRGEPNLKLSPWRNWLIPQRTRYVHRPGSSRQEALLCFLYGSGTRREEAHNINLDDLSEDFTELHISHEIAKFNRERTVPLAAPVPEILKGVRGEVEAHYLRRCRDEDAKQALFLSTEAKGLAMIPS